MNESPSKTRGAFFNAAPPEPNKERSAHFLGIYELSFHPTIISPEHVSHVDPRLTQSHEHVHRNLTFSSTFGFFSFLVAQLARCEPDPIHRYRFREIRDLLINQSRDPQEGCAYFTEFLDAQLVSADAAEKVRQAGSDRERWAVNWVDGVVQPLRLGKSLQSGFAYLLADLSLSSPIIDEVADFPPNIDTLQKYIDRPVNNPNSRFLAFARSAYWRRRSLRSLLRDTIEAFCKEEDISKEALEGIAVDLDRGQVARLEYLMDVSFQEWLARRLPDHRMVPVADRRPAVQGLLDRWRPQLSPEVQAYVPESANFLSKVFFDANDAVVVNPEGLERIYQRVDGVGSIISEIEDKELCVCILSSNAYPRVISQLFADGKIPAGFLQVMISIFDPTLPNFFEMGYSFWGIARANP